MKHFVDIKIYFDLVKSRENVVKNGIENRPFYDGIPAKQRFCNGIATFRSRKRRNHAKGGRYSNKWGRTNV